MIKHITESEALYFAGQQEHKDDWPVSYTHLRAHETS